MQAEPNRNTIESNAAAENERGAPGRLDAQKREKREQSSILFPYTDLEAGIEVVRAVHHLGGQRCTSDALAAYLDISPTGGNFRARIAPARIFGLMDWSRGEAVLTPLGLKILDSVTEVAARAEAFLNVPLYAALYERYKGMQLPGPIALEAEIERLGVSSKQKDKARQVFDRSARQAGFFSISKDRLVRPSAATSTSNAGSADTVGQVDQLSGDANGVRTGGSGGGGGGDFSQTRIPAEPPKALEYQLIDLMSEPDIDDSVKESIWSLVQYLTARKAKRVAGNGG